MSSILYLTQLLSHGGSCWTLGQWALSLWHNDVPGRIKNRIYPEKLLVPVTAKRNRLYCRGCLGRPLRQLKLPDDCDRRLVMCNSNRVGVVGRQRNEVVYKIKVKIRVAKGIFCIWGIQKSGTHRHWYVLLQNDFYWYKKEYRYNMSRCVSKYKQHYLSSTW